MAVRAGNLPQHEAPVAGLLGAEQARRDVAGPVERSVACFVVLVATWLRFAKLEFGQWRNDEEIIWLHALSALAVGKFPWVGIPSDLGIDNGPGQMLPVLPAALLQSPYVAYVLVASLNVLAVAALYRLGRLWGSGPMGLAAAALCAVSPWAVIHSRRLWGNDMIAPFAAFFITALWLFVTQRQRWRIVEVAVWLAFAVQMYIAAIVQIGVLLLGLTLAALQRSRLRLARLALPGLLALSVFVVLTAGYGSSAFVPHAADLLRAIRDNRTETPSPVALPNWRGFPFLLQSVGSDGYQYYLGHAARFGDATAGPYLVGTDFAVALFLCGMLSLLKKVAEGVTSHSGSRYAQFTAAALLLAWVLAMPVALIVHAAPVCACFLLPSYPAQYLVVALGAFAVGACLTRLLMFLPAWNAGVVLAGVVGRVLTGLLLGTVIVSQLGAAIPFFRSVGQYWPANQYGLPYAWHERIVDAVVAAWRPGMRIVVSGHGELDGVLRDEIGTRLPGASPRLVDDQHWLTVPGPDQPPMLVLATPGSSPAHAALLTLLVDHPAALRATVSVPGADQRFRVVAITAGDATRLAALLGPASARADPNVRFAGDARLSHIVLPPRLFPDQPIEVRLEWTILRTQPQIPAESYYVHLSDGGATTSALDAPFLPPGLWQEGERLWTFGALTDAGQGAAPRSALIGLYVLKGRDSRAGVIPVQAYDGNGRPITAVRQGPIVVRAAHITKTALPALDAHLAAGLSLVSADVPRAANAGGTLAMTLQWQARITAPPRYTVFVHVLDGAGVLKAQQDTEPEHGMFPTSTWLGRELVTDSHRIVLPATLSPGAYHLVIGVYPVGKPDKERSLTWPEPVQISRQ